MDMFFKTFTIHRKKIFLKMFKMVIDPYQLILVRAKIYILLYFNLYLFVCFNNIKVSHEKFDRKFPI